MQNKTRLLFQVSADDFKKIPGAPIAYWAEHIANIYISNKRIESKAIIKSGLSTGNNERFMRHWHEVVCDRIAFGFTDNDQFIASAKHYVPCKKGGIFRRWYGDNDYIIKWRLSYLFHRPRTTYMDLYYRSAVSWSAITSGKFHCRYYDKGFLFDHAAASLFPCNQSDMMFFLAYMSTSVFNYILEVVNPTINTGADVVGRLPVPQNIPLVVSDNAAKCVLISQSDWDSYETSWDFQENPLIDAHRHNHNSKMLSDLYGQVRASWEQQCETMRKLEVENNRIFIEIYGLQDELSPDVPWDEITLTCNPWYRYGKSPELDSDGQHFSTTGELKVGTIFGMQPTGINVSEPNQEMKVTSFPFNQELEDRLQKDTVKELISYAVGCMFGRYSLDRPGLAFAGGAWDPSLDTTFPPDADNVIPILDEDWFADDIVGRFQEFLKVAFGEENFHENMAFVEAALGKDIRSYFTNDFYADHVKMYQKRPIYWLFSSPTGAFSALIYLHRYRPDTVGTVLTYLRSHITKVNAHIQEQEEIKVSAKASASMKSKAVREQLKMQHELQELEDYERDVLYPLSTERLEIDLDDGVKVNYPKFGKALRPVKGLDAKEE